jgi:hypothetical protein
LEISENPIDSRAGNFDKFSNAHLTTICNRAWRGLADSERKLGTSASPLTPLSVRMIFQISRKRKTKIRSSCENEMINRHAYMLQKILQQIALVQAPTSDVFIGQKK